MGQPEGGWVGSELCLAAHISRLFDLDTHTEGKQAGLAAVGVEG